MGSMYASQNECVHVCLSECVCVCVCVREKEREECVCVRERELRVCVRECVFSQESSWKNVNSPT